MNKTVKTILIGVVACLLVGIVSVSIGYKIAEDNLGGAYHTIQEDFPAGISVDGSEVITGSGALSGTDGTFSGDVTVQGQCLVLNHASNDTPVYVTTASSSISATTTQPSACQ